MFFFTVNLHSDFMRDLKNLHFRVNLQVRGNMGKSLRKRGEMHVKGMKQ